VTEQNNTWMHYVLAYNIAPYAVQIKKLVGCTTAGEIVQGLQEEIGFANGGQITSKRPFNKKDPASELESSEDEPLFLVPLDWVFKYKGKFTVYITLLFLTKWLDLLSAHKMLRLSKAIVRNYTGDKSILFNNTTFALSELKNNPTKETLPQFLSYFSDNEKKIAYELFRSVCSESNQIFPFKMPFNSIFKHS
jgi:hypothetical protein